MSASDVRNIPARAASLLLLALAAGPVLEAADPLVSRWRTAPIAIDGAPANAEWQALTIVDRGPSVAVQNDAEFAYIVVSTADPKWRPLLEGGIVVWLDAGGGKAQRFGIWLPGPAEPTPPGATPVPTATAGPTGVSTEVLDQFDLLGPGKNQRRLVDVTPDLGVEVALGLVGDAVVYELKVPLKKTDARPYAVGVAPGASIGIGIATPETPRRAQRRRELVGSTGQIGGYQPYMPGYGLMVPGMGGRGFAGYADKDERPKPLIAWSALKLAAN